MLSPDNLKLYATLNISGKVIISFRVNKNGAISSVQVYEGVHPLLDKEALRVVRLIGNWTPGMIDGEIQTFFFSEL